MAFSVIGLLLLSLTFGGAMHRLHPLAVESEFFVDAVRGIPMLVIILYIGLPLSGGIDLPNYMRRVIAISIGYSAYLAEIFRSGIEAVPRGQVEAAKSLGLSGWLAAQLIILPQALRIVLPPLGNEFIAMIKDTSLLSILSVRDVTQRMREFQAASFLPSAPFNTAAVLYVFITLAVRQLPEMDRAPLRAHARLKARVTRSARQVPPQDQSAQKASSACTARHPVPGSPRPDPGGAATFPGNPGRTS
ncbi:MAG: amino acid ABC transporter permease [Spirochaetaceae bacterium]|nr:amino acid ABC transporter permease [Spirochaetaceae bacterium]